MRKATARVFACLFLIFQGLLAFAQIPGQNASLPPAEAARVRQIIEGLEREGKARPYFQNGIALIRKDWWDTLPPQHRENTAKYLSWGSYLTDGDLALQVYDTSVTVQLAAVNETQQVDLAEKSTPMELDVARELVFQKGTPEHEESSARLRAFMNGTGNPYGPRPLAADNTSAPLTQATAEDEAHTRRINEKYTPAQQRAARTLAQLANSSGLIMRRELNSVYVNPAVWAAMPFDQKKGMVLALRAVAEMDREQWTLPEIYDGYSGKKLMKWTWLGDVEPVE